jgi:hypothetical protein
MYVVYVIIIIIIIIILIPVFNYALHLYKQTCNLFLVGIKGLYDNCSCLICGFHIGVETL